MDLAAGDSYEPNSRGPNNSVDSRYRGVLDIDLIEYGGYSEVEQSMTKWSVWRQGLLTCNFPERAVKSRPEFVAHHPVIPMP